MSVAEAVRGRAANRPARRTGPPPVVQVPASCGFAIDVAVSLARAVIGPFIATAVPGAWDGRTAAAWPPKVSGPRLRRVFAVALPVVAVFLLADAVR
ncbi:hypothetical protein [Streptomyces hirsutus]|uniref:hypothetical protein n=1 Tax=Streptomyces hirsutus TaxID=35620 RepID=UPI00364714FC